MILLTQDTMWASIKDLDNETLTEQYTDAIKVVNGALWLLRNEYKDFLPANYAKVTPIKVKNKTVLWAVKTPMHFYFALMWLDLLNLRRVKRTYTTTQEYRLVTIARYIVNLFDNIFQNGAQFKYWGLENDLFTSQEDSRKYLIKQWKKKIRNGNKPIWGNNTLTPEFARKELIDYRKKLKHAS